MRFSDAAAIISAMLAVVYFLRMDALQWRSHQFTFVASHVLSGAGCVYSSYLLYMGGLDVLPVLMPLSAALYLFRSRDTYFRLMTSPANLDEHEFRSVF